MSKGLPPPPSAFGAAFGEAAAAVLSLVVATDPCLDVAVAIDTAVVDAAPAPRAVFVDVD